MKLLKISLIGALFLISFITGIFGHYLLLITAILLLFSLLVMVLFKKNKAKIDYLILGLSLCGFLVLFHFGIMVRNNLWGVCTDIPVNDRRAYKNNIQPIELDEIEKEISTYTDLFKKERLTEVNYKDSKFPIHILKPKKANSGKTKILIIAGTHGSEPAGVYAALEILKKIRNENLSEQFDFSFIYTLNPVGLNLFNRFNECNCDINRDYEQVNTVQTKLMRKLFDASTFDYVLDLHEGPYDGQYVLNKTSLPGFKEYLIDNFKKENIIISPMMQNWLQEQLFLYQLDSPVKRIEGIKRLDNFLDSLGVENIISESDIESSNMEERILGHIVVFEALVEKLNE